MQPATPATATTTSAPSNGLVGNAAPGSPGWRSPPKLTEAIWHMLTRQQPFAPARPPTSALVA